MSHGLLFLAAALLFLAFYLRYFEQHSIFFPMKEMKCFPSDLKLEYEDVYFQAADKVRINAWFLPCKDAGYTLIFCHGNAGNLGHRLEKLKFFHELGLNVFIFDYRGYGKSGGRPSESGIYRDAQAAYDYLLSRKIPAERIIAYGESIGGAVAIDLASKNKVAALIVGDTMTSAKDMVREIFIIVPYWIFSSRFDSLSKIQKITVPKLMVHSINDEIVPYSLGRKLYNAAPEPKEFVKIRGGHNSCFFESNDIIREKITEFIKRLPQ
jgi:fermentation-respiration switch protein FrsA (DUF1100 family)